MLGEEDRRGYRRMRVRTPARVTWSGTGETIEVQLEDLSATGCAFIAAVKAGSGAGLTVLVPSPDERLRGLERSGRVVRSEWVEEAEGPGWRVAVVFEDQ
ncbi:MAG: PilZ domain-containing protein [Pseudomonadota bacterium]